MPVDASAAMRRYRDEEHPLNPRTRRRMRELASVSGLTAGIVGLAAAPAGASTTGFSEVFQRNGEYCGLASGAFRRDEDINWFFSSSTTESRRGGFLCDEPSPAPADTYAAQGKLEVVPTAGTCAASRLV